MPSRIKREISNYVLNEMEKLFKYVISPENVAGVDNRARIRRWWILCSRRIFYEKN